jgi:hypothetical protein
MPEDLNHLEYEVKLIRPAFDSLSARKLEQVSRNPRPVIYFFVN